ncbi:MAG: 2-amino-4-hydroxy-6-hydroxymethyldihydropteridine diphosphokinase [Proteobacteria bacterium]|uniref:2-amino-4-hydroxy-6- hydroxymethyldihydropteridine diphosphokinase n=1 Tax=Rudaea sp. TaxID=2136325 RepID=UPI003220710B|nr:2-amino-4-hydroxy-6-hydroxymethyldihydropteridine diphosphokinase [Pseudomonadota bacterium]
MVAAYIGLGSNLDGPIEQVERALRELDALPKTRLVARSRLYRTAPWGGIEQPDFINAVARLETRLEAGELMRSLLDVEHRAGRRRDGERNGPRVLDLDLLLYGDERIDDAGLHVPHPRLHERAFVLVPLTEIAPDLVVPGLGAVRNLLAGIDAQGVVPADGAT